MDGHWAKGASLHLLAFVVLWGLEHHWRVLALHIINRVLEGYPTIAEFWGSLIVKKWYQFFTHCVNHFKEICVLDSSH
jgi:hypothetical protein